MIYVIYGQGGKGPLSSPFIAFQNRLRNMGYPVRDDILWRYPGEIARLVRAQKKGEKTILIGFSLGANCCTWTSHELAKTNTTVDLAVMYDPSVGVPGIMPSYVNDIQPNVKRAIHYRQGWSLLGRAVIKGHNVERVDTKVPHMLVQAQEHLHQMTIRAIDKVYNG